VDAFSALADALPALEAPLAVYKTGNGAEEQKIRSCQREMKARTKIRATSRLAAKTRQEFVDQLSTNPFELVCM